MPQPTNVPGSGVVAGKVYTFGQGNPFGPGGGFSALAGAVPDTAAVTFSYSPGPNTWATEPSLNGPRSFVGGTQVLGNTLVAAGGYTGVGTTPQTETLTVTAASATTTSATASAASATTAATTAASAATAASATTSATTAATTTSATSTSATASATSAATTSATASATTSATSTTAASATAASAGPPPPPARCRVPRVIGLRLGRARQRIRRANCSVGRVRRVRTRRSLRGRVIGQSPRPGAVRRRGFPVNLLVGRG